MNDRPQGDPDVPAHPIRDLVMSAAIEAELNTGRHERTEAEARRSVWVRFARTGLGWVLVMLGLAGLVLPGPGWLIVLLGLSMLPYAWAERTIVAIRRRIPGIPAEGRIPNRTWIMMGLAVVVATSLSVYIGIRRSDAKDADQTASARDAGSAESGSGASGSALSGSPTTTSAPTDRTTVRIAASSSAAVDGVAALPAIYDAAIAELTSYRTTLTSAADPCRAVVDGAAEFAIVTSAEALSCTSVNDESAARTALAQQDVKAYGPLESNGVTYWPIASTQHFPIDDEPFELAVDGLSDAISSGAPTDGSAQSVALAILDDLGVLK